MTLSSKTNELQLTWYITCFQLGSIWRKLLPVAFRYFTKKRAAFLFSRKLLNHITVQNTFLKWPLSNDARQKNEKKKANLYQKMKHVIWVSWGKVILSFFNASCCSAWELKGIECSFPLLLLRDLYLTIYVAILRPALAPQETNTEVLLDLSAWGKSS